MNEELTNKYAEYKKILDILPVNTKYNRKRKTDYINEEIANDTNRLNAVKQEIENRLSKFNSLQENVSINQLKEDLERCNIINEWNKYNTSYEKMHLDYYLYQLHRYYKEDLKSVNACIYKIIEAFKKVEVPLTKEDFNFNKYAATYMEKILNNVSDEELTSCFEELYWKNPDIVKTIEINFKSIYFRNEKKIDKYYENRHTEYLKKYSDSKLYETRIKLNEELNTVLTVDPYLIFNKFVSGEYLLGDYKVDDINKKKDAYFADNSYNTETLLELIKVLKEYQILIKYRYIFNDMKDKLGKKDEFKDSKNKALKDALKEEANLIKLNKKSEKKPLFGKKKPDEKFLFDYKEIFNKVMGYYNDFDNFAYQDLIYTKLNKDSTILEVLRLVSSNYLYYVKKALEQDENLNITLITEEFETLRNYVNDNEFILLDNIALLDEKPMKQLIVEKYNLGKVNLTTDMLLDDSIEKTLLDLNSILNYENVVTAGIDLNDIRLYLEYKKILESQN